ncbi:MAG: 6-hydroxymethylpterin diphosphokinase MptE-like protein [Bacillota bacterium]
MPDAVIEFIEGKKGLPTARAYPSDGAAFLLHSAHDPVAEARRLVERYPSVKEASAIICLGLGLGYHIHEVLRVAKPDAQIFVVEGHPQLREWFQNNPENIENIPWDRLNITGSEDVTKTFVYRKRDKFRNGLVMVEHPASLRLDPEFYDTISARVRDYVSLLLIDMQTAQTLNFFVQENNFANLKAVTSDPGISFLKDAFAGKPAVVVAAGPSLSKNIDLLAEAKGKSVIIAVGTALKAMLAKGIHPDLVVTLDPTELNFKLFEGLPTTEEFLCYEPQTHYKIPPLFEGRRFVFNSFTSFFTTWLKELYGDKGYIEPGGSVAIAAFGVACLIGANPIVFIGQDLSFTNGYTHSKGTAYEDHKVDTTSTNLHMFEVPAIGGGKVVTMRNFHTFIVRFEELFALHKDRLIIDATEGGAIKRGAKIMTFKEAIDGYFNEEFPVLETINKLHQENQPDPAIRERITKEFNKTARKFKGLIKKLQSVLTAAKKVDKISGLADRDSENKGHAGSAFVRGSLDLLRKRAKELNSRIKAVNAETKLTNLLDMLTIETEFAAELPEDASLKEQVKLINAIYGLYLQAAKFMRKQMVNSVKDLVATDKVENAEVCENC